MKCQVIIYLAANVGKKRSIDHPQTDSEINVLDKLNVHDAVRVNKIRQVIFSFSAGMIGEIKNLPISEDHPYDFDLPNGTRKLAAEKMCLVYNKLYGIPRHLPEVLHCF